MTVPNISGTTGPIPGDGSNASWSFSFSVASEDEVDVLYTALAGGTVTLDPSLYSVVLANGGQDGGTVTYPLGSGRLAEGEFLTIRLAPDFDQPTRLIDQGDFNPSQVERGLDHLARQTKALKIDADSAVRSSAGQQVQIGRLVAGQRLRADLLSSGVYSIVSGDPTADNSSALRVLYADDLGLRGDGTDETATINAKMLELFDAGNSAIIFLKSPAGYWTISAQVKVRSGITLGWGSPIRATRNGQLGFVGNFARNAQRATVATAASAGATAIVITPASGSASAAHPVGDQIELPSGQHVRVTAVNDGTATLTVTPALTAALSAGASLRSLIFAYCTSDWTRHDTPNLLDVEDASPFQVGDVVVVLDDELATNADTGDTYEINREMARVVSVGATTIGLDRSIKHWMSTTNRSRVVKANPCQNAAIQGATIEFIEPPTSTRVDTFASSLAYRCKLIDCSVPNEDSFGTRGRSFALDLCYQCDLIDCSSGKAKFTAAGEGYGVSFTHCTDCSVTRYIGVGSRHVLSFQSSTDCTGRAITGSDWDLNLIDWHGLKEIGCWVYEANGVGTGRSSQSGIVMGNPSWRAGSFECGAEGGEISDLMGAASAAVRIWGPVDDCDVSRIVFRRCTRGIDATDQAGAGSLEAGEIRIVCDFHRCETAGVVDMNANGSSAKPFNRLDLSGSRFIDFALGLVLDSLDEVVLRDVLLRTSRATASTYAIDLARTTTAVLRQIVFNGCQKHVKLIDTPARLIDCEVRNPGTTVWIDELSASAVSGDVIDMGLIHPASWSPGRVSDQSNLIVYSRPGMT